MPIELSLPMLVTIIGVLVALTNVITEVLKKMLYERVPAQMIAIAVGIILTVVTGVAYCQYINLALVWYYIVAMVVGGFLVAYASIFGFEKLKEVMQWRIEKKARVRARAMEEEAKAEPKAEEKVKVKEDLKEDVKVDVKVEQKKAEPKKTSKKSK